MKFPIFFKIENNSEIEIISNKLEQKINSIIEMVTELLPKIHDISKEELGDLVDQEMHNTSQTIESAVAKLEVNFHSSLFLTFFSII